MSKQQGTFWGSFPWISTGLCGLALIYLYWTTAYPSITWWVGSEYSLMAVSLGVPPAPGSLLLVLIGWLAVQLPLGLSQAVTLNGLAGLMAIVVAFLTLLAARRVLTDEQDEIATGSESGVKYLAMLAGVLVLALSGTVWRHAIVFQPYILTAIMTGLILLAMIRWWKIADSSASAFWLFIMLLLFGLDFSVHRTNLLLLPGALAWVMLRYPKTFIKLRSWIWGTAGLLLGLCFHFINMLLAARQPYFSADNVTDLNSFYNYVSLKQAGGNWLVNLYPRQADFFNVQIAEYWRMLVDNLFFTNGPLSFFGLLTVLLLLLGLIALIRTDYKLCIGLVILFLCSSIGGVLYFNTPENYFWPMDRHYLPSLMILTIFIAVGAGRLALAAWSSTKASPIFAGLILAILFALPVNSTLRNLPEVDSSNHHFAYDYAYDVLNFVETDAIVIVQGDVLWPIMYLQAAENVRPDVTLISQSLLNTRWYAPQLKQYDPDLPLSFTDEDFDVRPWSDTTIIVTLPATENPDSVQTVEIIVPPTVADKYLMVQDWLLIKMIQENQFKRPIYLTSPSLWLMPHLQPEGFPWKIVAEQDQERANRIQMENLFTKYSLRGFDDTTLTLDNSSMLMGEQIYRAHLGLTRSLIEAGEAEAAKQTLDHLRKLFPPGRLDSYEQWQPAVQSLEQMLVDSTLTDSLSDQIE